MKVGSSVADTTDSRYLLIQSLLVQRFDASVSTVLWIGVSVSDRNIVGHENNFPKEQASGPWNWIVGVRGG